MKRRFPRMVAIVILAITLVVVVRAMLVYRARVALEQKLSDLVRRRARVTLISNDFVDLNDCHADLQCWADQTFDGPHNTVDRLGVIVRFSGFSEPILFMHEQPCCGEIQNIKAGEEVYFLQRAPLADHPTDPWQNVMVRSVKFCRESADWHKAHPPKPGDESFFWVRLAARFGIDIYSYP